MLYGQSGQFWILYFSSLQHWARCNYIDLMSKTGSCKINWQAVKRVAKQLVSCPIVWKGPMCGSGLERVTPLDLDTKVKRTWHEVLWAFCMHCEALLQSYCTSGSRALSICLWRLPSCNSLWRIIVISIKTSALYDYLNCWFHRTIGSDFGS